MLKHAISPSAMLATFWVNRNLILEMTKREVIGRYQGSILGLAWSLFHPILMLSVYTFVFGFVFNARWGNSEEGNRINFSLILFTGMIVHSLFSESTTKAPYLILNNANYVKKVVFPLEILSIVSLGAALFHCMISVAVLLTAIAFTSGLHWTILLGPIIFFPLAVLSLGVSWLLASLGVFIRDVGQTVGIITTILMFLSPMFYPISAIPAAVRPLIILNPLALIMEQVRDVLIWGLQPDWRAFAIYSAFAFSVAWIGFAWFQKTRKGFADVL